MPPKGRGRGAGGGRGSGSGSAASSGAAAPATPAAAAASVLPAELLSAFRELPGFADALVPAPTQRGGQRAEIAAGGRLSRSQEQGLVRCLQELDDALERVPTSEPAHVAALAELLSQEPTAAAALLRLHAAALRLGAGDRLGILGVGSTQAPLWQRQAVALVPVLLVKAAPLQPSRHALSVLRFVRAMLRAQPFHALSRQLAAAAAALEAGRSGGGGGDGAGGSGAASSRSGGASSGSGARAGASGSGGGAGSNSSGRAGATAGGGGAGPSSGDAAGSNSSGGAGRNSDGGPGTGSGGGAGFSSGGDRAKASSGRSAVGSSSGGGSGSAPALTASEAAIVLSVGTAHVSAVGLALRLGQRVAKSTLSPLQQATADLRAIFQDIDVEMDDVLPGLRAELDCEGDVADSSLRPEAAEVKQEGVACGEEFARALAGSGFLEHAMRLTLLLQTRLPMTEQRDAVTDELESLQLLWRAVGRASGSERLICEPPRPPGAVSACRISPAAAAHLRSALSGRCVQTAVLVYGVGTLRVADGGPSYGLPAELQTGGLALAEGGAGGKRRLSPIALELLLCQLASGSALPPPGPGASLELALRVGRAALGTAAARKPQGRASCVLPPATLLKADVPEAVRLAVGALACGRRLLPRQRPSPRLQAQRTEWWRLAVGAGEVLVCEPGIEPMWQLMELVTEPLLAVWSEDCLDLDALPPVAPPEVVAALAAGLLPHLASVLESGLDTGLDAGLQYGADSLRALLSFCNIPRPGGTGLALFLTPLLAYGDLEEGEELVGALTALSQLPPAASGEGRSSSGAGREPFRQAAASFFRATAEALGRCRALGPVAEAPAGPVEAATEGGEPPVPTAVGTAAGAEPPPAHLLQLQQLLAP
ncbi:hypothetical protein HYH03_011372 [Edaphochlamys debaryana]|uniref:Uncharacterized protein n=1 Tax=Edaphochlamys debaryana TaxID=47281 RepID=A0A835XU19_9CHLO|nr:hypothetical protein HYH03_011372 [Edaphochlamys debaryana]|eukprot:KAG2490248.1 hypothetical protein HYH03_011372 [Edaphochlamys debaryana]